MLGARLPGNDLCRPSVVASDAASFAIVRTDPAMWPRVRTGRFVIVSPAAAVRIGDDVLVRLRGDDNQFLVKQFAGKNSVGYRFRQFHPDVNFDLQPQHSIDR